MLCTLYIFKYTGTLPFDFNSSLGKLVHFTAVKLKIIALGLLILNLKTAEVTFKKIFSEGSHRGETLVRCISDVTYNFLVVTIAVFIVHHSQQVIHVINRLLRLDTFLDVHFIAPCTFVLYQLIVAVWNVASDIPQDNVIMTFGAAATDVFVIAMGVHVLFVHYLMQQSFRQLNLKIKRTKLNLKNVFLLRNLNSEIVEVFNEMQKIYGFVILALIADHSFYVQIDVHHFISTLYDVSVGVKTIEVVKVDLAVTTGWAVLDFLVVLLVIAICSDVEKEVFN